MTFDPCAIPVAPSPDVLAVLRNIARAGFGYGPTKELAGAAGWRLMDDEPKLGFVAFETRMDSAREWTQRRIAVEVRESGRPMAFIPLFYVDDDQTAREPLDRGFQVIMAELKKILGQPSKIGEYEYKHRKAWTYSYSVWEGGTDDDATFVLVQDEFDIQFGMDVSIWVLPAGLPVEIPIRQT